MLMRLLIVLGILAYSNLAIAEKIDRTEINKIIKSLSPVSLKYDNKDGIWFSSEQAEGLLWLIETKLKQSLDLIESQDLQIIALKECNSLYKLSIANYMSYADFNKQMLDSALSYFPELEPPTYAWYKGRTASYIYGVLTGTVIIITSAYVVQKVNGK